MAQTLGLSGACPEVNCGLVWCVRAAVPLMQLRKNFGHEGLFDRELPGKNGPGNQACSCCTDAPGEGLVRRNEGWGLELAWKALITVC